MAWLAGRLRRARAAREASADEETAELTATELYRLQASQYDL